MKKIPFLIITSLLLASSAQAGLIRDEAGKAIEMMPTGKGWGQPRVSRKKRPPPPPPPSIPTPVTNGIFYHGGTVMLGAPNVYFIWYGNWDGNSATTILNDFVSSLGGSPYYGINTTYYNSAANNIENALMMDSTHNAFDSSYSMGKNLTDAKITRLVTKSINSGQLPRDSNAVYFVLTSADVNETSGFCTQYCGWHTHASIAGTDIKYSFVGNPDRCPGACSAQAIGPNENAGADGMASIVAHELEESVTDPDLNAWYDESGEENADKCVWKFGTVYTTANGAYANMNLNGKDYLIQQNWVNAQGGYCALFYP